MYILKNRLYKIIIFSFDLFGTIVTLPFRLFKNRIPKDVRKILVIRLDHIGDVLFTTSCLSALKEKYPQAKLDILISKSNKDIVKNNPAVDGIMTYDAPWFKRKSKQVVKLREFIRLAKVLRKEGYDIGIDSRGDIRHIILMFLAGIKYKIGYGITGGGFLLDREVTYNPFAHEVKHNLDILKSLGINLPVKTTGIFLTQEDENFARDFFMHNKLASDEFIVVIHPGAGYPSKRWIPKKWAQLVDRLMQELKAKIIIGGAREDKILSNNIKELTQAKIIDAVGKTSLTQLAAILKRAKLFIGTDSGPSHIAAAMGTPSVILYSGTNNAKHWAPLGEKMAIIQKDIPCRGCEKPKCVNNICMDLITIDEVMEAAKRIT